MHRPISFTTFARRILRRRYTPAQLVFAKVAFDRIPPCKLEGHERDLAREIFGDVETVPSSAYRQIAAYFGRDSFKTGLAIDFSLWRMVTADCTALGLGEVPVAAVASPDMKTSRMLVRRAVAEVKAAPELLALLAGEAADGFTLCRDDHRTVAFEATAASRGGSNLRGKPLLVLILEEADFHYSGDGFVRTDSEQVRAANPRVMTDGCVIFITTPWGDESLTRKLFTANFGAATTALAARGSTILLRDGDPDVVARVEAEMASDPENGAREFFVDLKSTLGSNRFFPGDAVQGAVDPDLRLPVIDRRFEKFGAGWDLAMVRDAACQVIVGRNAQHCTTVSMRELRPAKNAPLKLSSIVDTFAHDAGPFGITQVTADGHAREPAKEYTAPRGIKIVDAPAGQLGKVDVHLLAKKMLGEGRCTIPAGRLVSQLLAITSRQTPGGGLTITSPRRAGSGHGDLASAWLLALWTTNKPSLPRGMGQRPILAF